MFKCKICQKVVSKREYQGSNCVWIQSRIRFASHPGNSRAPHILGIGGCMTSGHPYRQFLSKTALHVSKDKSSMTKCSCAKLFFFLIVVGLVIHWNESAMGLHVFPIPIPTPTSLSTRSLWVFPVHQAQALVSCIQHGLVICFTLDNIHVSMLFFWNIPPSPSPTESKSLFCTSVSLFLFCV